MKNPDSIKSSRAPKDIFDMDLTARKFIPKITTLALLEQPRKSKRKRTNQHDMSYQPPNFEDILEESSSDLEQDDSHLTNFIKRR